MEEKILEIVREISAGKSFDENTEDLIAAGVLDSISVLRLVGEHEDESDIEVSAGQVIKENCKSIKAIAAFVEKAQEDN